MDDEKPDTRHLVLKAKEIVPIDKPSRPGDGNTISVQLIHRQNALAEKKASLARHPRLGPLAGAAQPPPVPPPVFKKKEVAPINPPAHAGDEEAISVEEILFENRVAEEKSGWGRIKRWKGRKSKRTRDFILLVGGLDIIIAVGTKMMSNTVSTIYGIAGITLITSTFAWIMFVVNDDY
jgi:hypothetical protein